jgi:DNA polymerase delta subunit 1
LLINGDSEAAINYCKGIISDLLQNRIDLSLLVITKGLGQRIEGDEKAKDGKYANKMAHVELAQKMRERDEASAPNVGDRVAYVMIKGVQGSKNYEKSEDPLFVLQNNIPIDYQFYLNNQIKQPLIRLFEPILKQPEVTLFSGEHTRNIYVPPKGQSAAGLFKFAVVQRTCLGCKNLLTPKQEVVCQTCEGRMRDIYIERK